MIPGAFWEAPYRPLFTAAGFWAVFCIAWWPLGTNMGLPAPGMSPPVLWHVHELFFGFAAAAVGGYLLTAMPNWVDRDPETGQILQVLLLFWAAARLSTLYFYSLPLALLLPINAAYPLFLGGLMTRRLLAGLAYRKLGFVVAMLLLAAMDIRFLLLAKAGDVAACIALTREMLIGFALLLTFVGARMIPAFTQSWHHVTGHSGPTVHIAPKVRLLALGALLGALAGVVVGLQITAALALLIAAVCTFVAAMGWRSSSTVRHPLLAGLHIAYLWLPLGLAGLGFTDLFPAFYPAGAVKHALTIGAISGLILAVAGRAGSHTATGQLKAPPSLILAMLCLWVATVLRLLAPLSSGYEIELISAAALLWCAAWIAFLYALRPSLIGPPVRPVLSGKKSPKS